MGLEVTCDRCHKGVVHRCGMDSLEDTLKKLLKWTPEIGFPPELARKSNAYYSKEAAERDTPFYSETYLYALLGKEDARTLMALFENVFTAMGIEFRSVAEAAWTEMNEEAEKRAAEEKRRAEHVKAHKKAMRPVSRKKLGRFVVCRYKTFYALDDACRVCEQGRCLPPKRGQKQYTPNPLRVDNDINLGPHATCRRCMKIHMVPREVSDHRLEERAYQGNNPGYQRIRSDSLRKVLDPGAE